MNIKIKTWFISWAESQVATIHKILGPAGELKVSKLYYIKKTKQHKTNKKQNIKITVFFCT